MENTKTALNNTCEMPQKHLTGVEIELLIRGSLGYCDDVSLLQSSYHTATQAFASELCRKPAEVVSSVLAV